MIVVTEKFTKTDSTVLWYYHHWTEEIIKYVEDNYIFNGKMMVIPEEINGEFSFTRIFEVHEEYQEWINDPVMIASRAKRDAYHAENGITLTITETVQ
jgi:hypothetical protein